MPINDFIDRLDIYYPGFVLIFCDVKFFNTTLLSLIERMEWIFLRFP